MLAQMFLETQDPLGIDGFKGHFFRPLRVLLELIIGAGTIWKVRIFVHQFLEKVKKVDCGTCHSVGDLELKSQDTLFLKCDKVFCTESLKHTAAYQNAITAYHTI
jgi:hypothetical protein